MSGSPMPVISLIASVAWITPMTPGSTPSTPPSAQLGTRPGRRRLRIQAAVARAVLRREHRRLPFEPEDAAVGVRLAEQHARVVGQIARREVVGAVEDDVVGLEQLQRVLRRQRRLVGLDLDVRIDRVQPILRRRELRAADVRRAVDDLPLQVAEVDDVEVDDADACRRRRPPDTSRRASRGRRRRCTARCPPSAGAARPRRPPA